MKKVKYFRIKFKPMIAFGGWKDDYRKIISSNYLMQSNRD